ncbi:Aldehyde dehydrogenase [Labilithrix luteola]|uniref:Aldehyde dehydrogenase n=1 Tax=Labilithrix luteola TaxID=1391654 RepID=A0A0K1PJY2_9BACT|nr:Aldehyde dehydrogenase [Labilithrix luteola]
MTTFKDLFEAQKAYFGTNVTRSHEWRIEQLDRMGRMLAENEARLQQAVAADFKTARQEYVLETFGSIGEVEYQKSQLKEWMEPTPAPVPRFLAKTGHKAVVYREPYGVTLVIGPFNGPLLLLLRPALTALAAGNTCILKLSAAVPASSALLADLVRQYFDPRAVAAVVGGREETTELLKLPFDFIFFTGSTRTGKVVARAAAENLTPVLLELGGQNPALVDETANIPDAAKKIVWGAMAWADSGVRHRAMRTSTSPSQRLSSPKPRKPCSSSTGRTQRATPTIRESSARERSRDLRRSSIPPKSSPAASPILKPVTSTRRSSIPFHGRTRSWRMRCLAQFCRSSRTRHSMKR